MKTKLRFALPFAFIATLLSISSLNAQTTYWDGKFFGADGITGVPTSAVSSGATTSVVWFGDSTTNSNGWAIQNYYRTTSTSGLCVYSGNLADIRMPKIGTSPFFGLLATPYLAFGVNTVTFSEGRGSRKVSVFYTTSDTTVTNYTGGAIPSNWIFADSVATSSTKCAAKTVTINNPLARRVIFTNLTSGGDEDIDSISVTSTSVIMPVSFKGISASKLNSGVLVSWNITNEINTEKFVIEKSTDGKIFTEIGSVVASNAGSYKFTDLSPSANNVYRIKSVDKDGSSHISSVVVLNVKGLASSLNVFPNPVINGQLNVQLGNLNKGNYDLNVYNTIGQIVFSKKVSYNGYAQSEKLVLPASVKAGVYKLLLTDGVTRIAKNITVL